jgi:hypothetical protein
MKSLEGDEQRPSRSIGQRVRDLRRLARELQDEDARKERQQQESGSCGTKKIARSWLQRKIAASLLIGPDHDQKQ